MLHFLHSCTSFVSIVSVSTHLHTPSGSIVRSPATESLVTGPLRSTHDEWVDLWVGDLTGEPVRRSTRGDFFGESPAQHPLLRPLYRNTGRSPLPSTVRATLAVPLPTASPLPNFPSAQAPVA